MNRRNSIALRKRRVQEIGRERRRLTKCVIELEKVITEIGQIENSAKRNSKRHFVRYKMVSKSKPPKGLSKKKKNKWIDRKERRLEGIVNKIIQVNFILMRNVQIPFF